MFLHQPKDNQNSLLYSLQTEVSGNFVSDLIL